LSFSAAFDGLASGAAFLFDFLKTAPIFRRSVEKRRDGDASARVASTGRASIFLAFFLEISRKKFYNRRT
jgi:hypothetical protein